MDPRTSRPMASSTPREGDLTKREALIVLARPGSRNRFTESGLHLPRCLIHKELGISVHRY